MTVPTIESPKVPPYKPGDKILTLAALGNYMEVSEESGILKIVEITSSSNKKRTDANALRSFKVSIIGGRSMLLHTRSRVHLNSDDSGLSDVAGGFVHYYASMRPDH